MRFVSKKAEGARRMEGPWPFPRSSLEHSVVLGLLGFRHPVKLLKSLICLCLRMVLRCWMAWIPPRMVRPIEGGTVTAGSTALQPWTFILIPVDPDRIARELFVAVQTPLAFVQGVPLAPH